MLMLPRPKLSGTLIGILVAVCFLFSGLVLPIAAHLPQWIEFELVLGIWWVTWWIILCVVLFNRVEVEHDAPVPEADRLRSLPWHWFGGAAELGSLGCFEGCIVVAGVILAFMLIACGVLFFIELLLPGIAFLLCVGVSGMLIQASRRHSACEGNAGLSAFWAMVWATAYTGPIALIIWGVQVLVSHRLR